MKTKVKKIISLLVVLVLATSVCFNTSYLSVNQTAMALSGPINIWDGSVAASYESGNGTLDDPYIIDNASQLAYLGSVLSSGNETVYTDKYFKLNADIYLNDISNYDNWGNSAPDHKWVSMGKYQSSSNYRDFGGTFDGDGHTIYGMYVSGSTGYGTGLFGAVNDATIKNLSIKNAYIKGTTVVGGFTGVAKGNTNLQNCSFSGAISATGMFVGGLVGKYDIVTGKNLYINSCYTEGTISSSGIIVGGFIGDFVNSTSATTGIYINNSYSTADITSNDYHAGGFIGRATNTSSEKKKSVNIRKSHFCGTLSSKATGTLVGQDSAKITTATDTYYNETIIGGAAKKQLIIGTAKTSVEFADGTVKDLLNNADKNETTDLWNWNQGASFPIKDEKLSLLKDLKISKGKFKFQSEVVNYKFKVANSVDKITVTPTASDDKATIAINGAAVLSGVESSAIDLAVGLNTVTIVVTAFDNSMTTYTLEITRKAPGDNTDVWDGETAASYAGGSGTEKDPYIIANAAQLAYLGSILNSGSGLAYKDRYFKLIVDIHLNDISDYESWSNIAPDNTWTSMGRCIDWSDCREFGGIFDGDGHTIYGLYVSGSTNGGTGLFGALNNATIKNLYIKNAFVEGTRNVGGIAGVVRGNTIIQNCGFSGVVNGTYYVGGLVGQYGPYDDSTSLSLNSCYTEGTVSSNENIAGGIIGFEAGQTTSVTINNCYSASDVTGKNSLGGFMGRLDDAKNNRTLTVRRSHFAGRVVSNQDSAQLIGSIVGEYTANSVLKVSDTYYSSNSQFVVTDGTAKTSAEFANGTVTNLLNACEKSPFDAWDWLQGKDYPVEKKARLKSLSLSRGGIDFSSTVFEYNISVSNYVDSLTITPAAYYSDSTITVDGTPVQSGSSSSTLALVVEKTLDVCIRVIASDESTTDYVLHITREAPLSGPSVWDGKIDVGFAYGDGTKDDPYIIETAGQLAFLAYTVNNAKESEWSCAYKNVYFKLISDIILNADYKNYSGWGSNTPTYSWTPIGKLLGDSTGASFGGIFDGDNHTIYGMYIDKTGNEGTGLFGAITGTVKNLTVKNSYVKGDSNVGGIIGLATDKVLASVVSNVGFSGIIDAKGDHSGGLIGTISFYRYSHIRVDSSYSEGSISGNMNIGGLVGNIENISDDSISGKETKQVRINNSYSGMTVNAKNGNSGGILGRFLADKKNSECVVRKSHFAGKVSAKSGKQGPIIGCISDNVGEVIIQDRVFYISDAISGDASDQKNALSKSPSEFNNGTVLDLLNKGEKNLGTDMWDWTQGDQYPVSPYAYQSLTDIILSAGSLVFDPSIFEYSVLVDDSVDSISLVAIVADESFSLKINDESIKSAYSTQALKLDAEKATIFNIEVTRPNGKVQTFTVQVVKGGYMVHFIGGKGTLNGEFGQMIYLDPNKKYTFSFDYYSKGGIGGLRTLAKYTNSEGVLSNMPPIQTSLDKKGVNWIYNVTIPADAQLVDGKVLCKFGIKKNENSNGYFANFKLTADDDISATNLFVNPDFKDNLYGWMDLKYATYTNNIPFKGALGELELVPYISSYFVKRPDDSNDKIFADGDWASNFTKSSLQYVMQKVKAYSDGEDIITELESDNANSDTIRIIKKIRRKKNQSGNFLDNWWILIAGGGAVLIVGSAAVTFFIIRKKRKNIV